MIKNNWTIGRIFKTLINEICNFYVSRVTGLTTPRSAPGSSEDICFLIVNKQAKQGMTASYNYKILFVCTKCQ
jgi:hypothetical protein